MQDENPFRGLTQSWPALATLLVAAMGLILARPELKSPRPADAVAGANRPDFDGSVPARLWQDPFTPVSTASLPEHPFLHLLKGMRGETEPADVSFLLVCLDAENNPEAVETRRRERYATLSALSTAGYVPTRSERISYMKLPRNPVEKLVSKPDELVIPFEWVRRSGPTDPLEAGYGAVCVLWLGENYDPSSKLASLCQLKQKIDSAFRTLPNHDKLSHHFAITGRIESSELAAILYDDAAPATDQGCLKGVTLYVTQSTAPFVRNLPLPVKSGLSLEYVIGTDDLLAYYLMAELRLRGIHPETGASIALIAERDTPYGRKMYPVFKHAALGKDHSNNHGKLHIHHYSYLRGLDGKLPGDKKTGQDDDKSGDSEGARQKTSTAPTSKEGEGDSQVDCVRRFVARMKSDHKEFTAIGVVGTDVYDKMLLLQALRPSFPQAVFFTTDLDVRLFQPGDFSDTRNLIIASHFGLSLTDKLQGTIAPFRSSYNTSSYLGVLRAVDYKKLYCFINSRAEGDFVRKIAPTDKEDFPVHVYEVSRSGAYELTLRSESEDRLSPTNPRSNPWITDNYNHLKVLGGLLLVAILLCPVSRHWQAFLHSCWALLCYPFARLGGVAPRADLGGLTRFQLTALLAAGLGLLLAVLIYISHVAPDGEPFEVLEGLSVWPTVILRFLASILCVYYLVDALKDLRKRSETIRDSFFRVGEQTPPAPAVAEGFGDSLRGSWQMWVWNPTQPEVRAVWQEFERHRSEGRRCWRCLMLSGVYLLLFALLLWLFDHLMVQARGPMAQEITLAVLLLTGGTLVGLLVFVVDCTVLSYRLVGYLSEYAKEWPEELVQKEAEERGLLLNGAGDPARVTETKDMLCQWLGIRLIDEATRAVAHLIYYPFVVLLILIVAQNRLFDDWHWNIPLSTIALLSAGTALACALMLQRRAKEAKEKVRTKLVEGLLRRVAGTQDDYCAKIERLRADVEGMRSGAFASFWQNPVVGALLLPLGGGGGLAVLETILSKL